MSTKKSIRFVAAWTASTGSISVLAQDKTPNLLALSTGKNTVSRSCIHTFSREMFEKLIPMPQETRDAVYAADAKSAVQFEEIDACEIFNMNLKIQILEAEGQEQALTLNILNRDKVTGEVKGLTANVKKNRDTKEPVYSNGKPVYRKTRLVPDTEEYKDVLITTVSDNKPNLPESEQTDEEDGAVPF
jgi:hypothetical protein